MRLVTYKVQGQRSRLGVLVDSQVIDLVVGLAALGKERVLPVNNMKELLAHEQGMEYAREVEKEARNTPSWLEKAAIPVGEARLQAPILNPEKIICIGLNYRDHAEETGMPLPQEPVIFGKYNNAIIGHEDSILLPLDLSTEIDYEAELAVIIGKRAINVSEKTALEYVAGYTNFNDISARNLQMKDGQWMKGKSLDTFAPMGPWLVTRDEIPNPNNLKIELRLNNKTMQSSNTSNMIFGVAKLVSFLSKLMTLQPGDVIATGTPAGVGFTRKPPVYLEPGDKVEVEVEGLGILKNRVAAK